jgi:hypothetical protein
MDPGTVEAPFASRTRYLDLSIKRLLRNDFLYDGSHLVVFSSLRRTAISSLEGGDSVYDELVDDRGTGRSRPLIKERPEFDAISESVI